MEARYLLSLVFLMEGQDEAGRGDQERARTLFQQAVALANEVLAIRPEHGMAHMTLGLSLKYLGERARALAALRQAVRCNPEKAELHFYLGDLLAEEAGGAPRPAITSNTPSSSGRRKPPGDRRPSAAWTA